MISTKPQRNISPNPDAVSLDSIKLTIKKANGPVIPKKTTPKKPSSSSGQLEIMKLEQESKGMEERLKVLRETLEKQKEKRGNTAYLWKSANAQKGTLNKYADDVLAAKNASLKARYSGIGDEADTKRKIISEGDPRRLFKHGDSTASISSANSGSNASSSTSAVGSSTNQLKNNKPSSAKDSFMNLSVSKLSNSSSSSSSPLGSSANLNSTTSTNSPQKVAESEQKAARPPPMPLPIHLQQRQQQQQQQPTTGFVEKVIQSRYAPSPKPMAELRMWRVPTPASGMQSSLPTTTPDYSQPPSYDIGSKIVSRPSTATQSGGTSTIDDNMNESSNTPAVSLSSNSLLDGQFDENQNREDFLAALREWRNAGKQEQTSSPAAKAAEKISVSQMSKGGHHHNHHNNTHTQNIFDDAAASVETSSTGTGTAPIKPSNELKNAIIKIHASASDLSYTEKLLRDKLRISSSLNASSDINITLTTKPTSASSSSSSDCSRENYELETLEMGLLDRGHVQVVSVPVEVVAQPPTNVTFEITELEDDNVLSIDKSFTVQEPED